MKKKIFHIKKTKYEKKMDILLRLINNNIN
jgi:hypothetical protein